VQGFWPARSEAIDERQLCRRFFCRADQLANIERYGDRELKTEEAGM
jgi:hypothetical protein